MNFRYSEKHIELQRWLSITMIMVVAVATEKVEVTIVTWKMQEAIATEVPLTVPCVTVTQTNRKTPVVKSAIMRALDRKMRREFKYRKFVTMTTERRVYQESFLHSEEL